MIVIVVLISGTEMLSYVITSVLATTQCRKYKVEYSVCIISLNFVVGFILFCLVYFGLVWFLGIFLFGFGFCLFFLLLGLVFLFWSSFFFAVVLVCRKQAYY